MINDKFSLEHKTILVTGASSGIGFEICKVIDTQKGRFIAVARREENLKELLSQCHGTEHQYLVADLSKEADLDNIIASIDKIDGLVHCAALAEYQMIKFYKMETFREMQAVNVDSIVYMMNFLSKKKKLNKNASIVLISSLGALSGVAGGAFYCATKAELIALSKVWAYELAGSGIRVNCVAPAIVETDLILRTFVNLSQEEIDTDRSKYPLGYGKPADVAYPVAFLLSEASKWISGQNIILDGGRTSNPNK